MTAPRIEKTVSIGNIVSWCVIAVGVVVAWTKLSDAQAQTAKDVGQAIARSEEARSMALSFREQSQANDSAITGKIAVLTTDVAVIKSTVSDISTDIKEMRRSQFNPRTDQ